MPPRTPRFARYRRRPGTPGGLTPIPSVQILQSQVRAAVTALDREQKRVQLARIQTIAKRALSDTNQTLTPIKTGRLRRSQRIFLRQGGTVSSRWLVHYAPVVFFARSRRVGGKFLIQRWIEHARALLTKRLGRDTVAR